jgi:hypothetical protein
MRSTRKHNERVEATESVNQKNITLLRQLECSSDIVDVEFSEQERQNYGD